MSTYVPVVRYAVHAGREAWMDTGETEPVAFDLARGRHLVAAPVTGTCMAPEVEPGDVVVFDQARREPHDGEPVVCTTERGELLVKRFYRLPDGSVLLAANDGVQLQPSELIIEGVVVRVVKQLRRHPLRAAERPGRYEPSEPPA